MASAPLFRVNRPKVSFENIEGETMVINFDTGAYYNLRNSALTVWNHLVQGATLDDLVTAVSGPGPADTASIRRAVSDFLDQLLREDLIVPENDGARAPGPAATALAPAEPFTPPVLEKYTDMQDFLLADPVHDTDEAGFPKPKPAH